MNADYSAIAIAIAIRYLYASYSGVRQTENPNNPYPLLARTFSIFFFFQKYLLAFRKKCILSIDTIKVAYWTIRIDSVFMKQLLIN